MSSRKEEKERLRQEREAAERAAAAGDARRKRIAIALGSVLAIAVAVIVVLAVTSGGDDDGPTDPSPGNASIPAQRVTDLEEAAEAAGCKVNEMEVEGDTHTSEDVEYKANPPTSGDHDPVASQDGIYSEGPPDLEQSVHALEHGRVNIQYKTGTPPNRIAQLEAVLNEEVEGVGGYHTLLFENQTSMPPAVAVTAWKRSLTCPEFNDRVFDAIRTFREEATVGRWESEIPEPLP